MRSIGAVCVAVAALMTSGCASPTFLPQRNLVPVTVSVSCNDKGVDVTVSPFVARVYEGDVVQWNLPENPFVAKIDIKKKHTFDSWPFEDGLPLDVPKNGSKGSGTMKDNPKKKYHYNIVGKCVYQNTTTDFVIDPDMIIIR